VRLDYRPVRLNLPGAFDLAVLERLHVCPEPPLLLEHELHLRIKVISHGAY